MTRTYPFDTISALLRIGRDDDPAIGAPGRSALTYRGLRALCEKTVADLNAFGIGRNDRVAMVLPNGPEMAAAFVAVACGATTAPLNPAYRAEEFDFYLSDLDAKALAIADGMESPARAIAEARGIPIVSLVADDTAPAGTFTLKGRHHPVASSSASDPGDPFLSRRKLGRPDALTRAPGDDEVRGGFAQADDIALVLHTSGTTSRPKIVPLSQANLAASATHIRETLALTREDVCLNIMPLFHIHGLIAAVLSSLAAGASVVCTPGFNALKFFSWFEEVRPSWYTAVPTMHQAILARAPRNEEIIKRSRQLRFVRSSSAPLPPQVMEELERTFHAPVIEAYGMTEAAHQMASNPLPPRARHAGSVGLSAGPEIAIMDETGALLPKGALGEIVIRGANVTRGYENNPDANAKAFTHGWFRTGDQGTLDADGYLRLTGRLKELINRGGEKISPVEVDTVLMDHPSVAQCLTFAMPHASLGEDVACAVVLREGTNASERELREFCATRIADFKVPRRIVFLSEIPKGATGKLQRIGLAEKLGLAS